MTTLSGHLLTPAGFVDGTLQIGADGRIEAVDGEPRSVDRVRPGRLPIVLPGFVDPHVHGGGGHDVMAGGDAALRIARLHARHGTTSLLATTTCAPPEQIDAALAALAPSCRQRPSGAARLLGVHLEGPYINPRRLGAQPDATRALALDEVLRWHALAPIRLITLAPEMPGHLPLIAPLRDAGFRLQIGHSDGSYEDGLAALQAGVSGFTHLFNAMSGLHHRAPGIVGAALAHARHAELIPDLLHVHPGAMLAALRAIPGLYCVTDATAAAGMPDGEYRLGSQRVHKCLGGVRLADGTLAGSTLTMDQALRNLVRIGLPLDDAARRVSSHAADYLGLVDRGRLAAGAWADLALFDGDLHLRQVWVEGEPILPVADSRP